MILAAGLLVLLGLGLFVGGVLTGATAFYWACVAACVVAAALLFLARRSAPEASRPGVAAGSTARDAQGAAGTAAGAQQDGAPGTTPTAGAAATPPAGAPPEGDAVPAGATAASATPPDGAADGGDPPIEEVEVTDLLLIVDLTDEVLVIDEHPRYHLGGCPHLAGRTTIPIPLDEARTDGFTPCALCSPDRTLARRARERKANPGN